MFGFFSATATAWYEITCEDDGDGLVQILRLIVGALPLRVNAWTWISIENESLCGDGAMAGREVRAHPMESAPPTSFGKTFGSGRMEPWHASFPDCGGRVCPTWTICSTMYSLRSTRW